MAGLHLTGYSLRRGRREGAEAKAGGGGGSGGEGEQTLGNYSFIRNERTFWRNSKVTLGDENYSP